MKFLLALFVFTSVSAFANLQDTLNNMNSDNDDIKKALLIEISQGVFNCSGTWKSVNIIAPVLTSSSITDWKFTYTASNTSPTILAEAKASEGKVKVAFTFKVSQDLKKVNSFAYQQWAVTAGEVNVGTLMKPIFEGTEILTNEQGSTCARSNL